MKPDLYTKVVLSIIAASLVWLCVQNTVNPPAVAAQGIQKVEIVSDGRPIPVNISDISSKYPEGLPVKVYSPDDAPLEVSIYSPRKDVTHSFAIPVRIDGGHVEINGPVTVRQAAPSATPAAPSKK